MTLMKMIWKSKVIKVIATAWLTRQQLLESNGVNLEYTVAVAIVGAVIYNLLLDHNFAIAGFLFSGEIASTIHILNNLYYLFIQI